MLPAYVFLYVLAIALCVFGFWIPAIVLAILAKLIAYRHELARLVRPQRAVAAADAG